MEKKFCYEYPRPAVTADCLVFGFDGESLSILLIERKYEPFVGCWALPGGFIDMDEDAEQSVKRELLEETGLQEIEVEQLQVFSHPLRDPRHRTITVAYYALVKPSDYKPVAGDDAARTQWFPLAELPELGFDHAEILQTGIKRLKEQVLDGRLKDGVQRQFSAQELQKLYELCTPCQPLEIPGDSSRSNSGVLLVIDAQNDFCHPGGALYVPGAEKDMERLVSFIQTRGDDMGAIVLSQDAHQVMDISHPAFWTDAGGNHPAPFTTISHADLKSGKWSPVFEPERVAAYLKQLEQQGEFPHVVWPEHCIAGSNGAAIVPELMEEVQNWARRGHFFTIVQKGQNPLTEHFGVVRANIPDTADKRTQENRDLLATLSRYSTIWIAGEARSHCVANTVKQLLPYPSLISRVVVLEDCMSDVAGFFGIAAPIYAAAEKAGARFFNTSKQI